jgi:hypothetical protein
MRANCTVCSPSRAALLTGRYADRVGVPGVIRTHPENSWGYFDPVDVPTLADELKKAGYHTAIVGKWHLGLESPNTPNERGFDFFHGFLGDMMDSYTTHLRHGNNYMRRNARVIEPEGHATDLFTDWAADYLRERAATRPAVLPLPRLQRAALSPSSRPRMAGEGQAARAADGREAGEERRLRRAPRRRHRPRAGRAEGNRGWTRTRWSSSPPTTAARCRTPRTTIPGATASRATTTAACACRSWSAGRAHRRRLAQRLRRTELRPVSPPSSNWPARPPRRSRRGEPVPVLRGGTITAPRDLYFVRREGGPAYGGKSYEAIIRGDWKLLQNDPYSPLELYNLKDDPQEQHNLAGHATRRSFNELAAALRAHIQRGGATPWHAGVLEPELPGGLPLRERPAEPLDEERAQRGLLGGRHGSGLLEEIIGNLYGRLHMHKHIKEDSYM